MNLTRAEAIQKCRDMWNWIADETEKLGRIVKKGEYFEKHDLQAPEYYCYLCEYTAQEDGGGCVDCYMCPLDFGIDGRFACENPISPYKKWRYNEIFNNAARYARMIANLPEREE